MAEGVGGQSTAEAVRSSDDPASSFSMFFFIILLYDGMGFYKILLSFDKEKKLAS